jgi:hypothetical protein
MATLDQIIERGEAELELIRIQEEEAEDERRFNHRRQERDMRKQQLQTELQHLQKLVKLQYKAEVQNKAKSGVEHANLGEETVLMQIASVAERKAQWALQDLLAGQWTECTDGDVYRETLTAWWAIAELPRSHTLSADALLAIGRGVARCPPRSKLATRLAEVENIVRDVAVWRCQLRVKFGNREKFRASLRDAFGHNVVEDKNLYSRLMQSHRQVINEHAAATGHATFLSNSQQSAIKHGRTRPKRPKRCDDYEENHATSTKAPDAEDEAEGRASPAAQEVAASATSDIDSGSESPTPHPTPERSAAFL